MFDIDNALCTLVGLGGSDLHLKIQIPPMTRVDGELRAIEGADALTPVDTETAVRTMLTAKSVAELEYPALTVGEVLQRLAQGLLREQVRSAIEG